MAKLEVDLLAAPGHLLRRAQQIAVELYVAEVGDNGPTPPQFALLVTVARHRGASQAQLVRLTGIDRSTMAEMIRRLIDRGFLARRRGASDGRSNRLSITAAGRRFAAAATPAVERAQARMLALLPPDRRAGFLADLRTFVAMGENPSPPPLRGRVRVGGIHTRPPVRPPTPTLPRKGGGR